MMPAALRSMSLRSPSFHLLLWGMAGTALAYWILDSPNFPLPRGFSPVFWYLLKTYDVEGNLVLFLLVPMAFLLRRQEIATEFVEAAGRHPWRMAVAIFPLLCLGSLVLYRNHPLSLDEYAVLFQARVFAEGLLSGQWPVDMVPWLFPPAFSGMFLTVSPQSGAVASSYWPGFSLILTPFVWLGVPWAANPLLTALSIPVVHRLAVVVCGDRQAGAWAAGLTVASPVILASSISYYSMPAHFLLNAVFALLLLKPSVARAAGAGLIGSWALTLHQPLPHVLFAAPFLLWLALRGRSWRMLLVLLLAYLPFCVLLGLGWRVHLGTLAASAPAVEAAAGGTSGAFGFLMAAVAATFSVAHLGLVEVRLAWLSKIWTWAALGVVVLAAWGCLRERSQAPVRVLAASLLLTFGGYCFIPVDQGHGWGFRYLHSAWFVMPVLAAAAVMRFEGTGGRELRGMVAWGILLSLGVLGGVRLHQVDEFMARHLNMVPPLSRGVPEGATELVVVNLSHGFYSVDLVQNDPFLREHRVTVRQFADRPSAEFVASHFPGYEKADEGPWGELWTRQAGQ
jgi:hypothetical protein